MRHVAFAITLAALAIVAAVSPSFVKIAVEAAVVATIVWIYFSLRNADGLRAYGHPDRLAGDPSGIGGPIDSGPGHAHVCGDTAHGGFSCDGGGADGGGH